MKSPDQSLIRYSVTIVGSFISCEDQLAAEKCIYHGALDAFDSVLSENQESEITRYVLWCLSNVTAGSQD